MISLGDAITLTMICPIVTIFMAWIFLGEDVGPKDFVAAIVGFCGVGLISKPSFVVSAFGLEGELHDSEGRALGVFICILAGIFYACLSILYKHAGNTVESMAFLHYIMVAMCLVFGGLSSGLID